MLYPIGRFIQNNSGSAKGVTSLTVPGGQEFHFPYFSIDYSYFPSNFPIFRPHFGPPDGRLAHPGRPWLRHWAVPLSAGKIRMESSALRSRAAFSSLEMLLLGSLQSFRMRTHSDLSVIAVSELGPS